MIAKSKKGFVSCLFLVLAVVVSSVHGQAPPPELISPEDGATEQPTTITFEWSSVSEADRYQIQVATDPSFSGSSIVFSDNTTATSITASGFSHDTNYYWRVRSGTDDPLLGDTVYGDWSATYSFETVEAPPPAPNLASPEDGATEISTSPILEWQAADRADTYQLQVAENSSFSSLSVNRSGITSTEEQVTNLQSTTTYYWRIRATNNGGTSEWSEVWSFTTREAPPPPVQLASPNDGTENVSTTPRMEWESADRADVYDFQLATDQNFEQMEVNLENVTSTHYDAELDGYTTYYWRVRGESDSGPGDWSEVWSFTTEQTGNEISIITPTEGELWKATETATIRWEAPNNVENITIEYRLSSDESWSTIAEGVDAHSSPYGWKIPATNSPSPQTHIKITDTDNSDITTTSNPFILYPTALQLQQNYSFTSTSSPSDYQLISLPANSNISLDELLQGRVGDDWNAFFDNGSSENYMVEFDGSDQFSMQAGRAFFVISKNDISVSEESSTVPLSSDTTFAIPLHEGWNMISNPFGIPVSWQEIQTKNNISSALWQFDGGYSEADQMNPYQGYYFFNEDDRNELSIPYIPYEESNKSKEQSLDNKRILTLKLFRDGKEQSSVQAGFNPTANGNRDNIYRFAPPGDFQNQKITIKSDEFSGRQAHLSKAILPPPESKQEFSIRVKSKEAKSVKMRVEGINHFTSYEIRLINQKTSKSHDLKQQQEVVLNPKQEYTPYLLVVGTPGEVKESQEKVSPKQLTLSQNYPNPFNGQTVIEYSVPEHMGQTEVNLSVFDILGRKVYTLENGQKQPGFYEVRWNGDNDTGQSLASGVYYYRLIVGQSVMTKKLTLIK